MSQMWTPVNSSCTEQQQSQQMQQQQQQTPQKTPHEETQQPTRTTRRSPQQQSQQQQAHQNTTQKTPIPGGKKKYSDPEKNKQYNDLYKAKKYNLVIQKWGDNGKYLVKQYLTLNPHRLQGRQIDEIDESHFPDFLPHDWTYKLWRIANKVSSYEQGIQYIRYQVYKWLGSSKCPTTFPSTFILDKAFESISDVSKPAHITERQLQERGLRIADSGLLELINAEIEPEYRGDYREDTSDTRDTARSLRSQSATSYGSSHQRKSRKASQAATELVKLMAGYLSDSNDYMEEDLNESSSNGSSEEESATKLVKLRYKLMTDNHVLANPSEDPSDDSSDDSSPVRSTQSSDCVDKKPTSSSVLTGKDTISTHVTKSASGILSLDSLHPETINLIGKYLSMKDRMSLALTNHRCRSAVRSLLLQDLLTLAIDKGNLSRTKTLLEGGATVQGSSSKNGNYLSHPLVRAAARGELRITQAILSELQKEHHGVSFEQRQELETAAFVTASGKGAVELVEYFLLMRQDTIDVNCVFNGKTALSAAVAHNQAEVVEVLLESGACATRKDLETAFGACFAHIAAVILNKYPDLISSCSVQFLHQLHFSIDEAIFGTKQELKEKELKHYMTSHDLGTIV